MSHHTVYPIANGQLTSGLMSPEYEGGIVYIFFYDAGGNRVIPTTAPTVSITIGGRQRQIFQWAADEWRFNAIAEFVQLNLTGVTGYSTYQAFVWRADRSIEMTPPGAFVGLRALTTQNYTEANVKNGVQYEVSSLSTAVAAAANVDVILTTGPNPIVIKAREITFNGLKLTARVYINPVFTGGTVVPYFNTNTRNPVAGTATIKVGATITSVGTEARAPTFAMGSAGNGNSVSSTHSVVGVESILIANTSFLLRITNTDAAAQDIATYATWYEGGTDLPL